MDSFIGIQKVSKEASKLGTTYPMYYEQSATKLLYRFLKSYASPKSIWAADYHY